MHPLRYATLHYTLPCTHTYAYNYSYNYTTQEINR